MKYDAIKRCYECGRVYDGDCCPECGRYATEYNMPEPDTEQQEEFQQEIQNEIEKEKEND